MKGKRGVIMTDYFAQFGLDTSKYGKFKTEINKAAEDGTVTANELEGTGLSDDEINEIISAANQKDTSILNTEGNISIDDDALDEGIAATEVKKPDTITEDIVKNLSGEELVARKTEINKYIESLTTQKEGYADKLKAAQTKLEEYVKQYDNECTKLDETEKEYKEKQTKLENLNKDIVNTQEEETDAFNKKVSSTTAEAIASYNPEKDGDFDTFLENIIGGLTFSTAQLDSMNGEARALAEDMNGIASEMKGIANNVRSMQVKIADQQNVIGKYNDKITNIDKELDVQNTALNIVNTQMKKLTGEGLTGTEVLAEIKDAEKDFVKEHNIDLTETYSNGNPKYVAAKGADGEFHIYEMDEKGENGTSLARKYGKDTGGLRGSDVVPSGSGYMRGASDVGEGQGRAVYSFSSVNECLTEGCASSTNKCYQTCSPLSFDIDGNGVKTSSEVVQFDIDGDGILDNVNNSDEWVLAFDKDGDGIAGADGSELFGDNTDLDGDGKADGYANGFEALKALAQKEGLTGEGDNELSLDDISLLEEKYGLVMTKGYGGETSSLKDLGITNINLAQTSETKLTKNFDGQHNDIMTQEGATFTVNGETREYADIWNAKLDENGKPIEVDADGNTTKAKEKNENALQDALGTKDIETKYTDEEVQKMLDFADGTDKNAKALEGKVEYEEMLAGAEEAGKDTGNRIEKNYYENKEKIEAQEEAEAIEAEQAEIKAEAEAENKAAEQAAAAEETVPTGEEFDNNSETELDFDFDDTDFNEYQKKNNKK